MRCPLIMKFVELFFTGAALQSTSPSNQPAPLRDGQPGMRAVSWSIVSNFPHYSGVQFHSVTWATHIPSNGQC